MKFRVRVLEARNLMAADSCGTSDPYVRIKWGWGYKAGKKFAKRQIGETRFIPKDLNPVWDEEYILNTDDGKGADCIFVDVWDHDMIGSDTNIGRIVIKFSDYPINEAVDQWIPLQSRKDKKTQKPRGKITSGEVHLVIMRGDTNSLSDEQKVSFPNEDTPAPRMGLSRSKSMISRKKTTFVVDEQREKEKERQQEEEDEEMKANYLARGRRMTVEENFIAALADVMPSDADADENDTSDLNIPGTTIEEEEIEPIVSIPRSQTDVQPIQPKKSRSIFRSLRKRTATESDDEAASPSSDQTRRRRGISIRWGKDKDKKEPLTPIMEAADDEGETDGRTGVLRRAETVLSMARGNIGRMFSDTGKDSRKRATTGTFMGGVFGSGMSRIRAAESRSIELRPGLVRLQIHSVDVGHTEFSTIKLKLSYRAQKYKTLPSEHPSFIDELFLFDVGGAVGGESLNIQVYLDDVLFACADFDWNQASGKKKDVSLKLTPVKSVDSGTVELSVEGKLRDVHDEETMSAAIDDSMPPYFSFDAIILLVIIISVYLWMR